MPVINTLTTPKNGTIASLNNSYEKISKGINDSINKGSNKEIKLIQAY